MSVFKFTAARIAALPIPVLGQDFYRDSKQQGFGVRVSPGGTISFFAEGRVNGKTRRITIGPWPQLTIEEARRIPTKYLREAEATAYLGFKSTRTLRNMRFRGNGPSFLKQGRHVIYRVEDLEEWLDKKAVLKTRTSDKGTPLSASEATK